MDINLLIIAYGTKDATSIWHDTYTLGNSAGHISIEPGISICIREAKRHSALHRQVHGVRTVERCSLGKCCRTVGSRRVAQDVEEHRLTVGQQFLATSYREQVKHVTLKRLCLKVGAVLKHTEGHGLQGVLPTHRLSYLVGFQHEGSLSQTVQVQRIHGNALAHAVVHGGNTTANTHIVNLFGSEVVVVRIALCYLHLDKVLALQTEHRVSEGVESLRRVGRVLVCQRHLHLVATQGGARIVLVAEVVERVVTQLLICQLYRIAIDAVVDSVVCCLWLIDGIAINIHEATHVGGVLRGETVGKVYDLAYLSLLEERRIALAINLLHLPAYRRQHQYILAGSGVGGHLHALTIGLHLSLMPFIAGMHIDRVALGALGVLVVVNQPRLGVTL